MSAGEIQRGITSPKQSQSFSKQEVKRKLFIAYLFVFRPLLFFLFWDNLFYCLLLLFKTSGAFVFLFFLLPFFFFLRMLMLAVQVSTGPPQGKKSVTSFHEEPCGVMPARRAPCAPSCRYTPSNLHYPNFSTFNGI